MRSLGATEPEYNSNLSLATEGYIGQQMNSTNVDLAYEEAHARNITQCTKRELLHAWAHICSSRLAEQIIRESLPPVAKIVCGHSSN